MKQSHKRVIGLPVKTDVCNKRFVCKHYKCVNIVFGVSSLRKHGAQTLGHQSRLTDQNGNISVFSGSMGMPMGRPVSPRGVGVLAVT